MLDNRGLVILIKIVPNKYHLVPRILFKFDKDALKAILFKYNNKGYSCKA